MDQQIATFLAVCRTASFATVDAQGTPFAANVQYASDNAWRLAWVSKATSEHSLNIQSDPRSAVTIYAHQDAPETIHGLQMRGIAEVLEGEDAEQALELYTAKYPFVAEPPFSEALARQRVYRFTPTWLRWIDNRRGFGWKFEKTL